MLILYKNNSRVHLDLKQADILELMKELGLNSSYLLE